MERKIGETFEFGGKKIEVKAASNGECDGCILDEKCTRSNKAIVGICEGENRKDGTSVKFVEVQEQQAEETKERKVGEVFEFEGKKLKVVETADNICFDCYFFDGVNCQRTEKEGGECSEYKRADYKPVIFMEVKDEQPQEQTEQPQELNLCEILKYCPEGETFWSPMLGDVKFYDINQNCKLVTVNLENREKWDFNSDGTISFGGTTTSPEIMLYPSREQRDWAKVKYEPKKERFDPKTLKPFDKVLVRSEKVFNWNCSLFSNIDDFSSKYPFSCLGTCYKFCIPYNDDTKHLVGTKDEAPDFYKYWED